MNGYRDIGEILAQARSEHMLSIGEVAKALHIRPRYIEALENGTLTDMPNLTYAKGYLKRYALYLSLDQAEIMRRFEIVFEQQGNSNFFTPHSFSREKRTHPKLAITATIALFFVFMIWAAWIRPEHGAAPLVEKVPEKVMEEPAKPAPPAPQTPCLAPAESVYPPCYWQGPEPTKSIMYLIKP
jgi:cytoskeletal protein RodZ